MKKYANTFFCFFAMSVVFIISGCGISFKDFQDKIIVFAKDKIIDETEYKKLLEMANNSDDDRFDKFRSKGAEIDGTKLRDYIAKFANSKPNNLDLRPDKIWNPDATQTDVFFNINVFIENSGSMNGYLNDANTQFKSTVYSLLTRLKLLVDKDSLNLYFVNKKEQPQYVNATVDDLYSFRDKLNPAAFQRISAGYTGESDLYEFIKRCLDKSNNRNLSVLVTDGIYSPGKNCPDAAQKLTDMKEGLFLKFSTAIKSREVSAMVLQFYGNFKGEYYNHLDEVVSVTTTMRRPFYIWFVGTTDQINSVLKSRILSELEGVLQNKIIFQNVRNASTPPYKILSESIHGEYSRDELAKFTLAGARASRDEKDKGLFGFEVAVDFSGNLQDTQYYDDKNNYKLNDNAYTIEVKRIKNTNGKPSLAGKTHILRLTTRQLTEGTLRIEVIGRVPAWVFSSSSSDDSKLLIDSSEELKTYGLEYLVKGVGDAFYPASKPNILHTLTITIKK